MPTIPSSVVLELRGEAEINIQAAKDGGSPSFDMLVYAGGPIRPEARPPLPHPIVLDLAGMDLAKQSRPVLRDHDAKRFVGHTTEIKHDTKQLVAAGFVSGTNADATEVVSVSKNGFKWPVSIGAQTTELQFLRQGETANVNGRQVTGPVFIARKSRPREFSLLTIAADDDAVASIAATAAAERKAPMKEAFQNWIAAMGLSPDTLTDEQVTKMQAKYDAERAAADEDNGDTGGAAGELQAALAAERAQETERKKIAALTLKAMNEHKGQLPLIEAMSKQAFAANWDALKFELELLRAVRPQAPGIIKGADGGDIGSEVYIAAMCRTGGMENIEKKFEARTLEAADKHFRHGLGIGEVLLIFARRNGYQGHNVRDTRQLLEAAWRQPEPQIMASAISTISLPNILSTVANRFMRAGFEAVESTWRSIAAITSAKDFRSMTSFSLTGDFQFVELPPGGEIKHGTIGETTYSNQVKTYARMFGIDRRDIINDDTNALTGIPRRLGRGGALKLNSVVWTAFMNNASFWTSGNGTFLSGVTVGTNDSRLNIEGLTRAEAAFYNLTDPDGQPIAASPRILLVPNALFAEANALMNSTEVRDSTANTKIGTANPHAGKFTVQRSSYLSNTSITGNSTTAWYLLADPNDVAVIEVAFLNGVQQPTVETADLDFNTLGIQMRGFWDFGAALQEYRGGVKSKGAA